MAKSSKSWQKRLDAARKVFDRFDKTGEAIIKRYRDERDTLSTRKRRFNILWSNIQVLKPALYGRPAKPEVSRTFKDNDLVGRVASSIMERALENDVEQNPDFDHAMNGAVEDRLLPGRGVAWVRYEANIEPVQVSNDVDANLERVAYECAPVDYVNWRDFLHSPARTWPEVWWVSRDVWMTKEEGEKRFGKVFAEVPMEATSKAKGDSAEDMPRESADTKAKVTEIWDKKSKKVYWLAQGFQFLLDEKDDPLGLEEFFPCPKPLFATTTTGTLVPVADYSEYQDQAEELDTLTQRMHLLTRALKVAGVYNGEFKELQRLLAEGVDNTMIGVSTWAAFAEKGALQGAVVFLPIKEIAEVIVQLTAMRQQILTDIWQIMGLSDIMRGSTDAQETLGAQEMKAQFGSMRLKVVQGDVARFATDIFRLKAEVMCKHFAPETLIAMSGAEFLPEAQDPQLIVKAIQLLKEARLRDFRINVESDSLAQIDEAAEKREAAEFITSMGAILKEAGPVVASAPTMMPFIGELMMLACRKQRVGRGVEMALEQSIEATKQELSQPKPDPAQLQQMQQEIEQRGKEIEKAMADLERKDQQVKLNEEKAVHSIEMATERQVFAIEKARNAATFEVEKQVQSAEQNLQQQQFQGEAALEDKARQDQFAAQQKEAQIQAKEQAMKAKAQAAKAKKAA